MRGIMKTSAHDCARSLVCAIVSAAMLLVPAAKCQVPNQPEPSPPPLGTLVDVGGYHVHLYCTGEGSPTVFIVGAAFSFDWGLVQPEVAKFTRVCTFDPSGTTWSDPFPAAGAAAMPTCADRVDEIHRPDRQYPRPSLLPRILRRSAPKGLYAAMYPDNIVGMVIVDHTFLPDARKNALPQAPDSTATSGGYSPPVLLSKAPIVVDLKTIGISVSCRNAISNFTPGRWLSTPFVPAMTWLPTASLGSRALRGIVHTRWETFPRGDQHGKRITRLPETAGKPVDAVAQK